MLVVPGSPLLVRQVATSSIRAPPSALTREVLPPRRAPCFAAEAASVVWFPGPPAQAVLPVPTRRVVVVDLMPRHAARALARRGGGLLR